MNREDIIRMAREAGFVDYELDDGTTESFDKRYERFAALVASAERERTIEIVQSMKAELEAKFEKTYMEGVVAGASAEREACADIADRLPRTYRETKEAHERATLEPFHPSRFGFDFAEMRQAEVITHAIRARGQA